MLLYVLLAATILGGLGMFGSALAADAVGGQLFGLLAWGAIPGVAGWWLGRRIWTGGDRVRYALLGVQVWLALGAISNIAAGSVHGFTALFVPALIVYFLTRPESTEWFRLSADERQAAPDPLFRPNRDRGQGALEYTGLIILVAGIIAALLMTNVGGTLADGFRSAFCTITGTACPDPSGSETQAGDQGPGGQGPDGQGPDGQGPDGQGPGGQGPGGGDSSGGTGDPGGTDGSDPTLPGRNNHGTGPDGKPTDTPDTYPETRPEPEAAYDAVDVSGEDADGGGDDGGDEEDCGGWGFFGCAWDKVYQVGAGLLVDGVWGDVTGIIDLFKPSTWSGMADYFGSLGDQWVQDSKDAGQKWRDGDYFDALTDWGGASVNTVISFGDDMFVGDEVRERWNNGEKTRAVTDVVWNVGSMFIPGYNVAKVFSKGGKLGKLGRIASEIAEHADDAGDAAKRAKKAADAGDVDGARTAAREADEAADEAEDKARRSGCTIASGPPPRRPFAGVGGSGTGVLAAAGSPDHVILADDGCDEEAKENARKAREEANKAWVEQKRAEEPERARKAAEKMVQYPEPRRNDTSDPRNYQPPEWADDLATRTLGDADNGDGYWSSRNRNPAPNWANESWLRYQEQITGTTRGQEYTVPHPREGEKPVDYDGWDSSRQTYLEAKNGYDSFLAQPGKTELTPSGKNTFVTEAKRQVEAARGKPVEWHFSNEEVMKAAKKAFRDEGLDIKCSYTPRKDVAGDRRPEQFDPQ
ncbi:Tox-REase-5 domain-containing protein [Streptomyces sp. NPDC048604]|uniref:Tox-REase-5 domain-containing protein n=1 Tax=Streptomyces sp. NPDC048604 TaxID=3365578 RepID=UPI0037113C15